MPYLIYVYFSFSIVIAAIIGGIRFSKIDPAYYPFVMLTWLAAANELVTYILSAHSITTNISNNIYVLIESLLLLWQAERWKIFDKKKISYRMLQIGLILFWLTETGWAEGLNTLHSLFRIAAGLLVLIIFIGHSNSLIFQYAQPVVRHPAFIISIGLVFFFSFKVLVEIYWWQGVKASDRYLYGLYNVIVFINLFVNLLYIIAVLWIPTKAKFTTYS